MRPELIDIGANLTHESFAADLHQVLMRAAQAGVHQLLVTGASIESSAAAIELARLQPTRLRATAGVHPHAAESLDSAAAARLAELLCAGEVAAAGEMGLDYYRDYAPRESQRAAFECQLTLAQPRALPLFLHQREAHDDFLAMLREHQPARERFVVHCFTDQIDALDAYLALGALIGITGWICDERRGQHLKQLVRLIPDDRLLIETDAPYLLPRDLKPKPASRRNEPAFLPHIAAVIARARGQSLEHVAAITTANAQRLFGFGGAPASP